MCMCGCRNLYYPYSSIILYGFMGRFQQGRYRYTTVAPQRRQDLSLHAAHAPACLHSARVYGGPGDGHDQL